MAEPKVWADGTAGTVIGAAVWNDLTVLATDWSGGRLHAFRVDTDQHTLWGDGYLKPEGIAVRGDEALIAEQGGTLLRQDLLNPGRAGAVEVATGLGEPHAVVWSDDGSTATVTDRLGRLLTVDLGTGAVAELATGLAAPLGLAIDGAGVAYVTQQGTGVLTAVAADGTSNTVLTGLVAPFLLSWANPARTQLVVTERAPAHRVGLVNLTAPAPTLQRLVGRNISQPSQAVIAAGRLVVTGQNRLLSLDASSGLQPGVRLNLPNDPLWPGGWLDVEIDTGLTGWTRAELALALDPPGLVTISEHPAAGADPTRPTVRLLAGAAQGGTRLVVKDPAGTELGSAPVIVELGADPLLDGPALWLEAPTEPPAPMRLLSAVRGLDDNGSLQPKALDGSVLPNWRVVAVLVDTGDATWPTTVTPTSPAPTIAQAQTAWGAVFTGPAGLNNVFREFSNGRLGITLQGGGVLGPVNLGGKWADWHVMTPAGWDIKDEVIVRAVAALQGTAGLDWTQVDAVFVIMRSAGGNFTWPYANEKVINVKVTGPDGKSHDRKVARVGMPHDQPATVGFTNEEVSAHELGHTLQLDDQYMTTGYSAGMAARALGTRELMANQSGLPHLSARHKLLLGFLDPGHVRSFTLGLPETATVDLIPASAGLPGMNRFSAVELRIAPGLSWFFELRQPTPGRLGDNSTTWAAGGEIVGYDAVNYKKPPVVADARRQIILLLDDGDGQGPILTVPEDYESLEAENPANIQRFMLEVVSITAGLAQVRVSVGRVDQPDPVLVNNDGPKGNYKSPDIQIRNALSDVNGLFLNVPVIGIPNRVVASVRNHGGLNAPNVSVRFAVLPFSTDDDKSNRWMPLAGVDAAGAATPNVRHDVPAGGAPVEFSVEWVPPGTGHYCVQARIDRYVRVPGAPADEPDVDNNLAQSNYSNLISIPASPASRESAMVDVHNPRPYPVQATVEVVQDSTRYRSYVNHRWLHLEPGQTRQVHLEVESKATSIWDAIESRWPDGNTWLRSWLPGDGCTGTTGTGVTVQTSTSVASTLRVLEQGSEFTLVRVEGPAGAPPPREGAVVLLVSYDDGRTETLSADLDEYGNAQFRHEPSSGLAVAYFSGAPGYASVHGFEFGLPG